MTVRTLPLDSGIRYSPTPERLAVLVGQSLGCRESTANQLLWGRDALNARCAQVVRVMRAAGAHDVLARWLAPIDQARVGDAPALTPALRVREELDDANEQTAQLAYDLTPNRDTAAALIRKLDAEIASSTALRQALAAEWGL